MRYIFALSFAIIAAFPQFAAAQTVIGIYGGSYTGTGHFNISNISGCTAPDYFEVTNGDLPDGLNVDDSSFGIFEGDFVGTTLTAAGVFDFDLEIYEDGGLTPCDVIPFSFEVEQAVITVPTASSPLVYDNTPKNPGISGTGYTVIGDTETNADDYTAVLTLTDQDNYIWSNGNLDTCHVSWSIAPRDISNASITIDDASADIIYKGFAFCPNHTVTDSPVLSTLLDGDNYTPECLVINAGPAVLKIEGMGNYTGSKTESFTINPAKIGSVEISITEPETNKPVGSPSIVDVIANGSSIGASNILSHFNISVLWNDGADKPGLSVFAADATYIAKITLNTSSSNYEFDGSTSVTVNSNSSSVYGSVSSGGLTLDIAYSFSQTASDNSSSSSEELSSSSAAPSSSSVEPSSSSEAPSSSSAVPSSSSEAPSSSSAVLSSSSEVLSSSSGTIVVSSSSEIVVLSSSSSDDSLSSSSADDLSSSSSGDDLSSSSSGTPSSSSSFGQVTNIGIATPPSLIYVYGDYLNLEPLVVTLIGPSGLKDVPFNRFNYESLATNYGVTTKLEVQKHDGEPLMVYYLGNPRIEVEIGKLVVNKANPIYNLPVGLNAEYGDLLSSVALPYGGIYGTWKWENPDTLLTKPGVNTHKATFIPDDIVNYNTLTGINITVTVRVEKEIVLKINNKEVNLDDDKFIITAPCKLDEVGINIDVFQSEQILIDGKQQDAVPTIKLSDYGDNEIPIKITSLGGVSKSYNVIVNKPIPAEQMIKMRWGNTLTVINNPERTYYDYANYKWYRNGVEIGAGQSYSVGTDGKRLDPKDKYSVEAVTKDGKTIRSCEAGFSGMQQEHGILLKKTNSNVEIQVSTPEMAVFEVAIYDIAGNLVYRPKGGYGDGITHWDTANLEKRGRYSGLYFVVAKARGESGKVYRYSAKLVLNR